MKFRPKFIYLNDFNKSYLFRFLSEDFLFWMNVNFWRFHTTELYKR